MSAPTTQEEIRKLLAQWLEFTESESVAIQTGAWTDLTRLQNLKAALQRSITDAMGRWATENPSTPGLEVLNTPFRAEVNRLISMEARNSELLAGKFEAAQGEKTTQDQSLRNLKKVHASYGRKPDGAWHSYS